MEKHKTASLDRDGNLSIEGTFNYEGSLVKLRKIIDKTIKEFGEDTDCKLSLFGSFPHMWSAHITITNK